MVQHAPSPLADLGRWELALGTLRRHERRHAPLRTARRHTYRVHELSGVRSDVDLTRLPESLVGPTGSDTETRALESRSQAAVVLIGKFDVDAVVRLRAFYASRRPTALRLQSNADRRRPGVARAVDARRLVAEHHPPLAPRLRSHGLDKRRSVAFLTEDVVDGQMPNDRHHVVELLDELTRGLRRLHRSIGVVRRPLSDLTHPELPARWETFTRTEGLASALGDAVGELIGRNAQMDVSLGHGDLVKSNMIVADGRVVLVDWEYARHMPIARDLAKPLLDTRRPGDVLATIRRTHGDTIGSSRSTYTLEEQLALRHVEMLTWTTHRRKRAEHAQRTEPFERQLAGRIELVRSLLDA